LDKLTGTVSGATALLDARTKRVEDGVSNFRAFQADVREFITRADTREEERRRFQEIRDKEIKDALQAHYQKINLANVEISNNLAHKNLLWNIAAVCVAAAGIAIALTMGIISSYVIHHASSTPPRIFDGLSIPQVFSARSTTRIL
jgi:hypothetical protein